MSKSNGWFRKAKKHTGPTPAYALISRHFGEAPLEDLSVVERVFPSRVRPDLSQTIEGLLGREAAYFAGVHKQYDHEGVEFSALIVPDQNDPVLCVPPQYEEIDVGEAEPVRCLKIGLWLGERDGEPYVVLMSPKMRYGESEGVSFQIATRAGSDVAVASGIFQVLEESVREARSYRGKVLSLESASRYSGRATGIRVHRLKPIAREQVVLPAATVDLLERNVVRFCEQRPRLRELGLNTKKGLLLYGPPGTGKTHTIQYLAGALPGHTTLVVTAEQVAYLGEYMSLARLLQPSIVVIEDVDLIARDRTHMHGPCEEALLNKLLNEMDGLREDADILFLLTTNRPQALEGALASRPGRVDQAIEFPLPDEEGRRKLVRLYARGLTLSPEVEAAVVSRTDGVSAAFIKELMRRSAQFYAERNGTGAVSIEDVDAALQEMLFRGGSLNATLLGGRARHATAVA